MPAPDSEPGRSSDRQEWFATTHWSVVLAAGEAASPVGGTVLNSVFSAEIEDEVSSTVYFPEGQTVSVSVNWSDTLSNIFSVLPYRIDKCGHFPSRKAAINGSLIAQFLARESSSAIVVKTRKVRRVG